MYLLAIGLFFHFFLIIHYYVIVKAKLKILFWPNLFPIFFYSQCLFSPMYLYLEKYVFKQKKETLSCFNQTSGWCQQRTSL